MRRVEWTVQTQVHQAGMTRPSMTTIQEMMLRFQFTRSMIPVKSMKAVTQVFFFVIESDLTPSKPLRVVCWVHKHRLYQPQCIASFFVPTVHKSARYEFQT